jgi:Vitamin K-dependent gamma-carboxylase
MTSTAAPAPTMAAVEGRPRGVPSPIAWLVSPAPAARLAVLRVLVGAYATAWAAVRLPAHLGHADQLAARWHPVGALAPLGSPPADVAIVLLAVAAPVLGLLFVAGWRYGAVGPLFAAAMLVLATLDNSWGQVFHTENLVVLHLLILAAAPAADVLAVGRRRPARANSADPRAHSDGRYGWPVRLAAVVVVLAYVLAGIAKLRIGGVDWLDGDTLRHLVANDNLRKALLGDSYSPIGTRLVGQAWLFPPLAVVTLLVELGAVVALWGGRWRTAWVAAAWVFHVGVLALMAIVFPYQLAGIAFAPFFRLERLADRYAERPTDRP